MTKNWTYSRLLSFRLVYVCACVCLFHDVTISDISDLINWAYVKCETATQVYR